MYQPAVAITNITRIAEKIVVPLPQGNIQSGATPPGRGMITRFSPTSERKFHSIRMKNLSPLRMDFQKLVFHRFEKPIPI